MTSVTAGDGAGGPGSAARWIKSSRSFANGNCVEVTPLPGGQVGVRDSKDPGGAILRCTSDGWRAFAGGVRRGEFDARFRLAP